MSSLVQKVFGMGLAWTSSICILVGLPASAKIIVVQAYVGFTEMNGAFQSYTYPGDNPADPITVFHAINNSGTISGQGYTMTYPNYLSGFTLQNGAYSNINYPWQSTDHQDGLTDTYPNGINDAGVVVGSSDFYGPSPGIETAFIESNNVFTPVTYTGAVQTNFYSINNNDQIMGGYLPTYTGPSAYYHSFIYHDGVFDPINYPNSVQTYGKGLNDNGDYVGTFTDNMGFSHGFTYVGGIYSEFNLSGAKYTQPFAINDRGVIAGDYVDTQNNVGGFVDDNGAVTYINYPGAVTTQVEGINNQGEVVGTAQINYIINTGTPEPISWIEILLGFTCLGTILRRRRAAQGLCTTD